MSSNILEEATLIYEGDDWTLVPRAPLLLLHDGGGTTFSYHCLDPTNRPLYGIQNSHLDAGGWWDGGIAEMVTHYIGLLSNALPQGGDVVLGGWSLGGILSLEMAHQLATDKSIHPQFNVLGIVFIDTVFPLRVSQRPEMADALPKERVLLSEEESRAMPLKQKVDLNMVHARMMIQDWNLPQWTEGTSPPPTILLRAKEFAQRADEKFVDHTRRDRMLGWAQYSEEHGGFIRDVVDIEGHHFNIFHENFITDITKKICKAADVIERRRFPNQNHSAVS